MSWQGKADFQSPLRASGGTVYRVFEQPDRGMLAPSSLALKETADGRIDFLLTQFRGPSPLLPPKPYGQLSMGITGRYNLEEGLATFRDMRPAGTVACLPPVGGFLRLWAAQQLDGLDPAAQQPQAVAWNALGDARVSLWMPDSAAVLFAGALVNQILPIQCIAEMRIEGVSPRVAVRVTFDPAALMSELQSLCATPGLCRWEDLVGHFRIDISRLPLQVTPGIPGQSEEDFAWALADRVAQRFAAFVPSPAGDWRSYLQLVPMQSVAPGSFTWDLSEPFLAQRPCPLMFDPLESARACAAANGPDSVIRRVTVQGFSTGLTRVAVFANIPAERIGVAAMGVTLTVPPHPPTRSQALVQTIEFNAPEDSGTATFLLSPTEPVKLTYKTFVILKTATGQQRYDGLLTETTQTQLTLQPCDFPLVFAPVRATPELVAAATVDCTFTPAQKGTGISVTLSTDRPEAMVPLAKDDLDSESVTGEWSITARARDSDDNVELQADHTGGLNLDLTTFPAYGRHDVALRAEFAEGEALIAIDLLPESSPDLPAEVAVLAFTPHQPDRTWQYRSKSIFRGGFRYRPHTPDEMPVAAWSVPQLPAEVLTLKSPILAGGLP